MPLNHEPLHWVAKPVTRKQGVRILERDQFRCQCTAAWTVRPASRTLWQWGLISSSPGPAKVKCSA